MLDPQTIVALCDCPCECTEVVYAGDHPRFSGWCLACQAEHHERLDITFPIQNCMYMASLPRFNWTICLGHGHSFWLPVDHVRKHGCACGCGND